MNAIDRGGLYRIKDEVLMLFHSIEFEARRYLHLVEQQQTPPEVVIEEVVDNIDVQYHWTSIASEIDEEPAQLLLNEIVRLWLAIRGNSEAGAFLEQYKRQNKRATKKTFALRKKLKRKKLEPEPKELGCEDYSEDDDAN